MKQLFKILSILFFVIVLITSYFALNNKLDAEIPMIALITSMVCLYFYIFIDALDTNDNYESQDNWYQQLEDEEADYKYYPDRD